MITQTICATKNDPKSNHSFKISKKLRCNNIFCDQYCCTNYLRCFFIGILNSQLKHLSWYNSLKILHYDKTKINGVQYVIGDDNNWILGKTFDFFTLFHSPQLLPMWPPQPPTLAATTTTTTITPIRKTRCGPSSLWAVFPTTRPTSRWGNISRSTETSRRLWSSLTDKPENREDMDL